MQTAALVGSGAVLLAIVLVVVLYLSRLNTLSRRVGSFECSMRAGDSAVWRTGIAQYGTQRLVWWRARSLAPRPARTWARARLDLVERSEVDGVDELGRPMLRVLCRHDGEELQLTMSSAAYAGLVSWLEAGPRPVGRVL